MASSSRKSRGPFSAWPTDPGGGIVIIGVNEDANHVPSYDGLSDSNLESWHNYDEVSAALSPYADPHVTIKLEVRTVDGHNYVVITVDEFADIPVICAQDKYGKCRVGAVYVRTRRKPETSEIPSQTEMREVLTLATDKSLAAFLRRMQRAGLELPPSTMDATRFNHELDWEFK